MMLAVLADKSLKHGPLEAFFSIDEEVGMVGAKGLKPGFLKGEILFNLDSEEEGELFIGCAGGVDVNISLPYQDQPCECSDSVGVRLSLKGLKGGDSGVEIHLGRGNANKLIARILKKLLYEYDAKLVSLEGGNMPATPSHAKL